MDASRTKSFSRYAANLSWICPIVTIITFVLLIFSGQIVPRKIIALIASGALCLIALGLIFGVVALLGISKQGTGGILVPAIVGIIINGLLLSVVATFISARYRPIQHHGSIETPSVVAMWSNQSAAANRRPAGQSDGSGNLPAIVAADRAFPAAVVELIVTHVMRKSQITPFAALFLAALASGCFCKDVPREQKLADCTTNALAFRVAWPAGELFSIVLGVPYSDTNALAFSGELVFRQSTGIVARVQVGSHNVTPCNWLDNQATDPRVAGYILTWGRTNATERLDNLFTRGQSYDVEVHFTESPPLTSTLWLHWIGQIGH